MFRWLLLFFIVTPIVEMYLLLTVGDIIGALPTIGLVLLTAVIGVTLLRRQGLATLNRAQTRMSQGALPVAEMTDGILLAVAGPLLLTPGFATDAMGFLLLVPAVRRSLGSVISQRLVVVGAQSMGSRGADFDAMGPRGSGPVRQPGPDPDVIEGEFQRKDGP